MARTWTFHDGLTDSFNYAGQNVSNADKSLIYYYDNTVYGFVRVYSYDGTTQTDLGSPVGNYTNYSNSIAFFKDNLYILINDNAASRRVQLYRYDGGTGAEAVWTNVWEATAPPTDLDPYTDVNDYDDGIMTADDTYLYIRASGRGNGNTNDSIMVKTADVSTFTAQTFLTDPSYVPFYLLGPSNGTPYVYAVNASALTFTPPSSGEDWDVRYDGSSGQIGSPFGGTTGYTFWMDVWNIPYPVNRSDDWGLTLTNPAEGGLDQPNYTWVDTFGPPFDPPFQTARYFRDDVVMACTGYDVNIFTYDGVKFVADGVIPDATYNCIGFFELNNRLYAITRENSLDTIRIYDGGSLVGVENTGEFYYGIESLIQTADVSFSINPKGMTVNTKTSDVVIVSKVQQAVMAVRLLAIENHAIANDITEGLDTATDTAYNTVEYI